eukprot:6198294-Pleurochrysis_carterae.AAC.2
MLLSRKLHSISVQKLPWLVLAPWRRCRAFHGNFGLIRAFERTCAGARRAKLPGIGGRPVLADSAFSTQLSREVHSDICV